MTNLVVLKFGSSVLRSEKDLPTVMHDAGGVEASVKPVELPSDHPLAQVKGVENRLIVETESGSLLMEKALVAGPPPKRFWLTCSISEEADWQAILKSWRSV